MITYFIAIEQMVNSRKDCEDSKLFIDHAVISPSASFVYLVQWWMNCAQTVKRTQIVSTACWREEISIPPVDAVHCQKAGWTIPRRTSLHLLYLFCSFLLTQPSHPGKRQKRKHCGKKNPAIPPADRPIRDRDVETLLNVWNHFVGLRGCFSFAFPSSLLLHRFGLVLICDSSLSGFFVHCLSFNTLFACVEQLTWPWC